MARQFIYHMHGLSKSYSGKKVLENVHLSFYPDAKIGVLGPNGAGKSTLLRIMAGLDKEFSGEAWLADVGQKGPAPCTETTYTGKALLIGPDGKTIACENVLYEILLSVTVVNP